MSFGHNNPPTGIERPLYALLRAFNTVLSTILRRLDR